MYTLRTLSLLVLLVPFVAGCRSTNHLADYDYHGHSIAVISNIPPYPEVDTADYFDTVDVPGEPAGDRFRLARWFLRAGTAVVKEVQAYKVRSRMDSALAYVDVSERIADRTLERGATYLRLQPLDHPADADYLLDVRVRKYGIEAESWQAQTYYKIVADVQLIETATGRRIWKTKVKERAPITPTLYAGRTLNNMVTAEAFSRLSVDDIVISLEQLADYAADRMTYKLQNDLDRARRNVALSSLE